MNIAELIDTDKGRWVAYQPCGQPHTTEIGRLKDWNLLYIWVVFAGPKPHWDTSLGERTATACLPETLRFIFMRLDGGFDQSLPENAHSQGQSIDGVH